MSVIVTTYSIGHSVARRLRGLLETAEMPCEVRVGERLQDGTWHYRTEVVNLAQNVLECVWRLEEHRANENDVADVARAARKLGDAVLADLLEGMLPPIDGAR